MSAHAYSGFRGLGRTEVTLVSELTSVDDYRDHVLARLPEPDPIELRLSDALGLVLAQDVASDVAIPAFANSAMDGYAVVAADVAAATQESPARLTVVGEVAAGGAELPEVAPGRAVRIMTGAPVPPGADAVVPVETTAADGPEVLVHRRVDAGEFVRATGEDVGAGQRLLPAGRRLDPADIGLLAAVGAHHVVCYPAPRVVILSTGDELVAAEREPGPGQIRDSNGPMIAALTRQAGGVPYRTGVIRDDRKALMSAFDTNIGHADLFVATGGVSAGAYDHIRDVVGALGSVDSFKVAMKPGMPQVFGHIGGVPVFGLPGNPVSAFVSFEVFVRPAMRTLQRRRDLDRPHIMARLGEDVRGSPGKRVYLRVRLRRDDAGWVAMPTGDQRSHLLTSVVRADGLAEIPEDADGARAGERVRVHLLVDS